MADRGGGTPRCLKTKPLYTGRIATKLPNNPLSRLQYREVLIARLSPAANQWPCWCVLDCFDSSSGSFEEARFYGPAGTPKCHPTVFIEGGNYYGSCDVKKCGFLVVNRSMLGGLHRHHQRSVSTQIFHKLPGRLGFNLRYLVDESVLHEGHVFLGFSKNGQFVLSYTLHVEADEHTAYPIYVYRLQWWLFRPHKALRQVSEVRLFGEEEIQQDLYIAVCEWPTDETRILVYGYCSPGDAEEKRQCFITITAMPPVEPCWDCSHLATVHMQSGFHAHGYEAPPRCFAHAFTVHTKYELAPPYPSFAPKIYLKMDGVLIVNTGDSLIALSVDLEDNAIAGQPGFGLYSPRFTRSVSNLSTTSSCPSDDQTSPDSQDRMSDCRPLEEVENTDAFLGSPSANTNSLVSSGKSGAVKDSSQGDCSRNMRERHSSTGKENYVMSPVASTEKDKHTAVGKENQMRSPPPPSDKYTGKEYQFSSPVAPVENPGRLETPSKLHRAIDVYNFEGSTPKKDDSDTGEYGDVMGESPSTAQACKPVRATLSFSGFQQTASMGTSAEEISLFQSDLTDSQPSEDPLEGPEGHELFHRPSGVPRIHARDFSMNSRNFSNLTLIPPENFSLGKNVCISPSYGRWDQEGSSTCSSCVSSPIIVQSDTQCFTYSVRRYVEGIARPDSPADVEDDLNLAYHSVLPLEVHGANYAPMRLLTKQTLLPSQACIVVKQLTLDIEHYLAETARTTAEWGHRYLAFTDYDVQILEVCPDTSEVIALVFVLVRARPPNAHKEHTKHIRSVPKLYQSGFKLIWNLQTGSYTTLDVEDLVEVNQAEILRKRWQPGHRICDALQRRFVVPQIYSRSVHVLTNEAVFKGQSLKMLLDRHHYVAILL